MVYIIDDDEQTADLLAEFIQLMGLQTKTYTQARHFFEDKKLNNNNAILILDLIMPDMDGIEVMRELTETDQKFPIILVSGYDSGILHSAEQLALAHSLEIIATLNKPIAFKRLQDIILTYTKLDRLEVQPANQFNLTVSELNNAIKNNQLVLHYQPQIDINTGSLTGVEALVRWQHPAYGLIYPNLFIPLAENNGLIGDLTALVIRQAVQQSLLWRSEKLITQVSVNISAENITSLSLPEQLSVMLATHQIDSSLLTLEITESALMGKLTTSLDILTRLRMKGIELSIDDFGTGYSSLSQLYRVPFTELKIDRSFVMNIANDDEARGIVKTCIMLGHELNMHVVAEGVEDQKTLTLLKEMGCDIAQGFYIAKPMPTEQLMTWIKNQ